MKNLPLNVSIWTYQLLIIVLSRVMRIKQTGSNNRKPLLSEEVILVVATVLLSCPTLPTSHNNNW